VPELSGAPRHLAQAQGRQTLGGDDGGAGVEDEAAEVTHAPAYRGVWARGRALRRGDLPAAFTADAAWGIAALLWLATGLARAFGGLEKGTHWYLHYPLFHVKMGLFVAILLLEIYPMVTLIRWRIARRGGGQADTSTLPTLVRLNTIEVALTVAIPFVAGAMARGVGGFIP
jgi:putative membrane protein